MIIYKIFRFESAHYLPNVPQGHKCGGMHGHSYTLKVSIKGKPSLATGWIMDYSELKAQLKPLIGQLDHQVLNTIEGLETRPAKIFAFGCGKRSNRSFPRLSGSN